MQIRMNIRQTLIKSYSKSPFVIVKHGYSYYPSAIFRWGLRALYPTGGSLLWNRFRHGGAHQSLRHRVAGERAGWGLDLWWIDGKKNVEKYVDRLNGGMFRILKTCRRNMGSIGKTDVYVQKHVVFFFNWCDGIYVVLLSRKNAGFISRDGPSKSLLRPILLVCCFFVCKDDRQEHQMWSFDT